MDIKLTEKCFKGMYGAYAAMFTPYDKKGRVDEETIARIIEYGLKGGLKGFYLTGTTGEWWLLSVDERKQLMNAAVKAMRGRGKLIAHVGANNTDDSVELARHAAAIGIDWVSSVAPQLYRTSFDATMYHYSRISSATDLPFMIYSFGSALVPERDIRFFDLPNVKGMKYTGRDYYAAQRLKRKLGKETIWFAGCDEQLLCGLALGNVFSGGIGTTYNIIPAHFAKICELAGNNDFFTEAPFERVIELESCRIYMTHGHRYNVFETNEGILREAARRHAQIAVYGHSHYPVAEVKRGILLLNPGSLAWPRQEGRRPSYIVLELSGGKVDSCEIRYLDREI